MRILPSFWILYSIVFSIAVASCVLLILDINQSDHNLSVMSSKNQAAQLASECKDSPIKDTCYYKKFEKMAATQEISKTLAVLSEIKKIDTSTVYCHSIAHKIAGVEVAKNPEKWMDVFSKTNGNECSRGFFHGIIEGYTRYHPEFKLTSKTIQDLCSVIGKKTQSQVLDSNAALLCVHAIGHMLIIQEVGDLKTPTQICGNMSQVYSRECMVGVFMEYTNRENLTLHGILPSFPWNLENADHMKKICNTFSGEALNSCWQAASSIFGQISNGNSTQLYTYCSQAGDIMSRDICYNNGIGFIAFLSLNKSGDIDPATLCRPVEKDVDSLQQCIIYVIEYSLNYSLRTTVFIDKFCSSFNESEESFCYKYTGQKLSRIAPSQKEHICNSLSIKGSKECLRS